MHAYVYSKPACSQCDLTKSWLTNNDVPFTELDITLPANMDLAAEVHVQQAPMVVITKTTLTEAKDVPFKDLENTPTDAIIFSGFRPDLLKELFPADPLPSDPKDFLSTLGDIAAKQQQ